MKLDIDIKKLTELVKDTFLNQDKYKMDLMIKEFDGADFFFFYIFEARGEEAPRFYFITSPYDDISKGAPQGAQVFDGGELVLQLDYTEYVKVRTGLMDALALDALSKDPSGKKVLYIGAGGVAEWSLRALKAYYPSLNSVDYTNTSGGKEVFEQVGQEVGVETVYQAAPDLGSYDFILMHTNAHEPVLQASDIKNLKSDVFISLYGDKREADIEVYKDATVVINWAESFEKQGDLVEAVKAGLVEVDEATVLTDLLNSDKNIETKGKVVYRSGGTPMQNIAVLKYLMNK